MAFLAPCALIPAVIFSLLLCTFSTIARSLSMHFLCACNILREVWILWSLYFKYTNHFLRFYLHVLTVEKRLHTVQGIYSWRGLSTVNYKFLIMMQCVLHGLQITCKLDHCRIHHGGNDKIHAICSVGKMIG